ncbi:hypothetical protein SAMN03159511_2246 [Pseudomonas sp. NFACC19-2]|nr:hypothetical protein SAMN03159511_2246 [Pseudomonas sp. NFACC19-2]
MSYSYDDAPAKALTAALHQLDDLKRTLRDIRGASDRPGFSDAVRAFQGHLAAFREELEDTRAEHLGGRLALLANSLEELAPDAVGLRELLTEHYTRTELDALHVWLGHAWNGVCLPDQMEYWGSESLAVHSAGDVGPRIVRTLAANFEEARGTVEPTI